jgi:CRISPR/Cas system CMR-associated protein Cmr3 (group 5 of RAMP superfamily)
MREARKFVVAVWSVAGCVVLAAGLLTVLLGSARAQTVSTFPDAGTGKLATASVPASGARKPQIEERYGKLPLNFEENRGQTDASVKFLSRGNGYGLFFTANEAVLALRAPSPCARYQALPDTPHRDRPSAIKTAGAVKDSAAAACSGKPASEDVIRMRLQGARGDANPIGVERRQQTANYFIGSDPAKWRTQVATYGKIQYAAVYPGVDLVYYGRQRQLEYDFVVAPGADPQPIRLRFAGANKVAITRDGNLAISASQGTISFEKPVVYQETAGGRRMVDGAFALMADGSVGFSLGRYDRTKPLVIDPTLTYSTYLGGTEYDSIVAIAADAAGNTYVTGLTTSEDFPLTPGAYDSVNQATLNTGQTTAFISKMNPSGTALLYSTYLGGASFSGTYMNQGDYGHRIAVDAAGNAYITGWTFSTDFPVTAGAFQRTNTASINQEACGFVSKLNPAGVGLVYSTYLCGSQITEPLAVALDSSGDAYVSGIAYSSDFPTTSGAYQTVDNAGSGNPNQFVTKVNPTGTSLVYSTFLGGSADDGYFDGDHYTLFGVAVDSSGDAYVAGYTSSTDFPVTKGAYQTTNNASANYGTNLTLAKLNPAGSALIYSTYIGGTAYLGDYLEGLVVDSSGSAYLTGYTFSTDFPVTKGAFQTTDQAESGHSTGFALKMNAAGSALDYSTFVGGSVGDSAIEAAVDASGDLYLTGLTQSANFPVTSNAFQSNLAGSENAILAELNPTGTALLYATYLGGNGSDQGFQVALGGNGGVYVGGQTSSSTFPVSKGAFETTYASEQSTGFIAGFDFGAAATTTGTTTAVAASENPQAAGSNVTFTATVTADSGTTVPTGNVVFSIDLTTFETVALSGGKASYSTSTLAPGPHYVLASYAGNSSFSASGGGLTEQINGVAATPSISPAGGTYTSAQTVTMTDATIGATIYYTINGGAPAIYTGPITVSTSETISAVAAAANNSQSAAATATYTISGSTPDPLTIATVSAIAAEQTQTITITGQGFGTQAAYSGDSNFIGIWDVTQGNWSAGYGSDEVGLNVTSWSDKQIVLGGFTGGYGEGTWTLKTGDVLLLEVWNAPTGSGPAVCQMVVGAGATDCATATVPGVISTVAGNGREGSFGSNILATGAELNTPAGIAADAQGNFYFADYYNNIVRKVTNFGVIETIAGNGVAGYSGDSGAATSAELSDPWGIALDASGNVYLSDLGNCRIRKVSAASGTISTVAGNGSCGFAGDGGAATSAELGFPAGIALDRNGNLYIADQTNERVRKVTASGVISTVAGNGTQGYAGDGGAATSAELYTPATVSVDGSGNLYISDRENNRIRKVSSTGTITTFAGNGTPGYTGDGGLATAAEISNPVGVWADSSGNVLIADSNNNVMRKVNSKGIISTVAGNGSYGYSGDGGFAILARMEQPYAVAEDSLGNLYITDTGNEVVRKVTYNTPVPAATPAISPAGGTYTSIQTVTITDATAGATIYYTTNGSTPTTASTKYTGAITVSASETIEAIAVATGYSTSAVAKAAYTITLPAATPAISPAGGTYTSIQTVTITDATAGATIYYTTNGTAPTTASTKYTGAITVSSSETVEAIAVATGYSTSAVATAAYTITLPAATPAISPAGGTYTSAQTVTITDATAGATIYYTTNGSAPTTASTKYTGAITVSSSETIEAIAVATGYSTSAVAKAAYTITLPAATPAIAPAGGTYTSIQTVTITDATAGATIYYTTNGSAPTTASTKYTGAITVSSSETIEAIAVATGYSTSAVATAVYTITLPAATPAIAPAGGTYTSTQTVTITDATAGATIYYTTNGTAPTTSSTKYAGAITVSSSETVEAIAVATGYSTSAVAKAAYTITLPAATPAIAPAGGTYTSAQTVTITDATAGATIYYTTNGSAPTTSSTKYTGAITVSSSETVEAIAVATGYSTSAVATASYTINLTAATPVFSVAAGTYESVQTVTISSATAGAAIYYTTNGTTPTAASAKYTGAIAVSSTETLEAIAVLTGDTNSAVATAAYTIAGSPAALASGATGVTATGATLNALVDTEGIAGSYQFEYGTSATALTSSTTASALGASSGNVAATAAVTGLAAKTTYYFKVVATTAGGSASGAVLSFTTE